MEQTVKHITDRLVGQLPDDKEAYKLIDLRQSGFPRFVIKRVEVELERNLSESIILPETEWAQMNSDEVRHAWEQFVSAIRSQARLPKSYAYAVVETAISDIIDILVQPRKNLSDIVFGASKLLKFDELIDRMDTIVVYRHFASLIPRYMEKRGYVELSKEQCEKIVAQADEKLTAHYTPLNWAQMLEPLFLLMKERIDSNLLRLFFQDKNKPRVARRFDLMNKALNRSELIEELSTPDLPDDDDQNELFSQFPQKRQRSTGWEGLVKPAERESTSESRDEQQDNQYQQRHEKNGEEEETNLNTLYSEETEEEESGQPDNEEQEEGDAPLNAFFGEETPDEDDELSESEHEQANSDQHTELEANDNSDDEIAEDLSQDQEPEGEDEEETGTIELADDDTEGHQPMWQRFLSPEEVDQWDQSEEKAEDEVYESKQSEEQIDENEEDEFEEEPLIDLTTEQEPDEKDYERLHHLLDNDRERFVEEIFRGGDEAYEEAVREIATKEDWRSASQFIEKEVFKRNLVDMYSEAAVDFTDRLHSYFMETTKS